VLVDVSVAGFTAGWHFPGAKRFRVWAEQLPWCSQGGLAVIRTSDSSYDDSLSNAVAECVRGLHGEKGYLDVRRVAIDSSSQTPFAAVLGSLEISTDLNPFEAREPLRMALQDRACLFIIKDEFGVPTSAWETFVSVVEHYGKLASAVRLCAVVLDDGLNVLSEPSFDFTHGISAHPVLGSSAELDTALLWQAYLHVRACWEAGGAPMYAFELGTELLGADVGDDDCAESLMSSVAVRIAELRFDLDLVADLLLQSSRPQAELGVRQAAREQLARMNALWRPPNSLRLEIVPWLSRALLKRRTLPGQVVWALRHNLVCMPLATEIIAHCLRTEAHIRTQLHGRPDPLKLPEHAKEGLQRLRSGADDFVSYPPGYPLPPTRDVDVWAFAALGETLAACAKAAVSDLFRQTLWLRNSLTHGHYVNWLHVTHAKHQLERFEAF
jgi:hypothetical protein